MSTLVMSIFVMLTLAMSIFVKLTHVNSDHVNFLSSSLSSLLFVFYIFLVHSLIPNDDSIRG